MPDPCEHYLKVKHDCESYVECVLRSKGFKIVAVDQHCYDIEAYYPSGMYYYFIEGELPRPYGRGFLLHCSTLPPCQP